jgi:hypothetical protein
MASFKNLISNTSAQISSGGTITGDLVINGDLQVDGGGSLSFDEIIEGTSQIKVTDTSAFLVEKADGTDVFVVDTTNSRANLGARVGTAILEVKGAVNNDYAGRFENTDTGGYGALVKIAGTTADDLAFQVRADSTNILTINGDSNATFSGNLGLGVSPSSKLHINVGTDQNLEVTSVSSKIHLMGTNDARNANVPLTLGFSEYIFEQGSMGIGETSPDTKVHIKGTGDLLKLESTNDGSGGAQLDFYHQSASTANDDLVGIINFGGDDSDGNATTYSRISGLATNVSSGSETGALQFWTRTDGSTFSEKMRLDNNGRLGIGTDSPSELLHLQSAEPVLRFTDSDDSKYHHIFASSDDLYISADRGTSGTGGNIIFRVGSTSEKMRIDGSGNVGIGSTSPDATLHLQDGNNTELRFTFGSDQYINKITNEWAGGSASDCKTRFFISDGSTTNANEVLTLTGDKRVGIGTNSPEADIAFEPDVYTTGGQGIRWQDAVVDTDAIIQGVRQASNVGIGVMIGANCQVDTSGANTRFNTSDESSFISVDPRGDLYFGTGGTGANPSTRMHINSSGNIGIGSTPKTHLDVQSYQADGITIGADNDANRTRTNSTSKSGGITGVHYTNAEESIRLIGYSSSSTANTLLLGGGNGDWNSATLINFYVGANTTATAGDLKFKLDTNSRISLSNNDSGGTGGADGTTGNTLFGAYTGLNIASGGEDNAFFGHASGNKNTTGEKNTGFGTFAGFGNRTGDYNTYVGYGAGFGVDNENHSNNTAVGYNSLKAIKTGGGNVSVGSSALSSSAFGETGNVAIGYQSMSSLNEGSIGTADNNIAIGQQALLGGAFAGNPITVNDNIAIGAFALDATNDNAQTGTIAIGRNSLGALTTGTMNVAVGYQSQASQTTGNRNTTLGYEAMYTADGGEDFNTVIGSQAGYYINNDASHDNVIIGKNALQGGTGTLSGNVAIGTNAMDAVSNNSQTGAVAIGTDALGALTTGARNTAVGYQAMDELTTGEDNVALGYGALGGASTSDENKRNVAIGNSAMSGTNAGASQNIAIGYAALDGALTATADNNTAVGYEALGAVTSGRNNVAIGSGAGDAIIAGVDNVVIGHSAEANATDAGNCIVIGADAVGQDHNSVTLGNADVTAVYMAQDSGALVHTAGIQFPASQVADGGANVLDDYEEGTWTPAFVSASGHAPTISATFQNSYTKIGNTVTVSTFFTFSDDGGGTDQVVISGVPFAIASTTYYMIPVSAKKTNFSNNTGIYGLLLESTDDIYLYYVNATGDRTELTYNDIDVSSNNLMLTFTYIDN